jgi:hypothetical protein
MCESEEEISNESEESLKRFQAAIDLIKQWLKQIAYEEERMENDTVTH